MSGATLDLSCRIVEDRVHVLPPRQTHAAARPTNGCSGSSPGTWASRAARRSSSTSAGSRRGEVFPPFLYISIINSCNLRCQGCWVDVAAKQQTIDAQRWNRLITRGQGEGNVFFGIVGGEPFMHPESAGDPRRAIRDCYFQVFTNGHFITDEVAKKLRRAGQRHAADQRRRDGDRQRRAPRAGRACYSKTMQGIAELPEEQGVYRRLHERLQNEPRRPRHREVGRPADRDGGVLHLVPRLPPDGAGANARTVPHAGGDARIRKFVVDMRAKKPIIFVDAYYDDAGQALCPAATGITHHINPWGGIEPCPIVQFVTDSIHDESKSLVEKFNSPFLQDVSRADPRDDPRLHRAGAAGPAADARHQAHHAEDGTVRQTAIAELNAMQVRPSQYNPVEAIPEKSLAYRLAKKWFFNSFGVYDGRDHSKALQLQGLVGKPRGSPAHGVQLHR